MEELKNEDTSIGLAYRTARNWYLPNDAEWEVWWSPPLITTGYADVDAEIMNSMANEADSGKNQRLDNKFLSFFEYTLYGDPAFVPYVPCNN